MGTDRRRETVMDLIKEHGGELARANGHQVYKFPDGRTFTCPSTPSDVRAWDNSLSDLRHFLGIVPNFQEGERREHIRQATPSGFEMPTNAAVETDNTLIPIGECFACGKPWEMTLREKIWWEQKIAEVNDPTKMKFPTRCKACRDAKRELRPSYSSIEIIPGVTLTRGEKPIPAPIIAQPAPVQQQRRGRFSGYEINRRIEFLAKIIQNEPDIYQSELGRRYAKEFGTDDVAGINFVQNHKKQLPLTWLGDSPATTSPAIKSVLPGTVEELATEEERLQAQLETIRKKKELLIEAKRLKIVPKPGVGLVLQKEGNSLPLTFSQAEEMVEQLVDWLAEHKPADTARA